MNLFFYIISALAIIFFFASPDKKKQKIPYFGVCLFLLFCACFRNVNVGIDTPTYVEYFLMFRNLSWTESLKWDLEPGYIILNKLIGTFTGDPQVFLAVLSLFVLLPIFALTWKKSVDPLLSILVFVSLQNWYSTFAALRQWCAVAVFAIAYYYIVERKLIRFILVTIVAYTFHQSALFMLPIYFLYSFRITRGRILACAGVAIAVLLFADKLMLILNSMARIEYGEKTGGGLVYLMVLWIIVIIFDMFASPIQNESDTKMAYIALLVSAVVQPLSLKYGEFARIHLYCWYGTAFSIPALMQYMSRNYGVRDTYLMKLLVMLVLLAWYGISFNGRVFTFMWQ